MAIKAILFDLDNTLIDFWKMKEESSRAAMMAMIKVGLKVDKNEAHKKMMILFKKLGAESENIFQEFLKSEVGRADEKMLAAAIKVVHHCVILVVQMQL
jgi:putative hydrolase of the HAD superfamily